MQVVLDWPYKILKPVRFDEFSISKQKTAITNTRNAFMGVLISLLTVIVFFILNINTLILPLSICMLLLTILLLFSIKKGPSDYNIAAALLAVNFTNLYCALLIPESLIIYAFIPLVLTALLESRNKRFGIAISLVVLLSTFYFFYARDIGVLEKILISKPQLQYMNFYMITIISIAVLGLSYNWMISHSYHFKLLSKSNDNSLTIIQDQIKDLENMSIFLQLLSKQSKQLVEEVRKAEDTNTGFSSDLKELLNNFRGQLGLHEKLCVIQQNVDKINHQFYRKLENVFGKLTKAEKEICSLKKLNFSTKEIARIRNTSEGTIYVTKNRLKKKLKEVKPNDFDLDTLIKSL